MTELKKDLRFDFEKIAASIASDKSPVGIDAKKTHVLILQALGRIEARLESMDERLHALET